MSNSHSGYFLGVLTLLTPRCTRVAQEQEHFFVHFVAFYAFKLSWCCCTCAGTFSDHFGAFLPHVLPLTLLTLLTPCQPGFPGDPLTAHASSVGLILVRPTRYWSAQPVGLPSTPNPNPGTLARFLRYKKCFCVVWRTKSLAIQQAWGLENRGGGKRSFSRTLPISLSWLFKSARFCMVCPCQPRWFDWFAQPVWFAKDPKP